MANMNDAARRTTGVPLCTISEEEETVTVRVEMPGVEKSGLEVKIQGNELSVTGDRATDGLTGSYLLRERRIERYHKLFTVDDTIARDRIDAVLNDGVLDLTLHKVEAAKPRLIRID